MSATSTFSSGIAGRYATALFDLVKDNGKLADLEKDMGALGAALESADLRKMISSPIYTREEQGKAIDAIAGKLNLSGLTKKTLGLMAQKRRLFVLPRLVAAIEGMIADERGETTASVTTAKPLSDEQRSALESELKKAAGKDVRIETSVDETLLGGMIVQMGSKMIDTSLRSKLASLKNVMKEAR
ncbi:F0F1 ATP synthase subunit delta [Paracoccaceae bacterium GXU_MW_L88]